MFWMWVTDNRPVVLIDNPVAIHILKPYHSRISDTNMCRNTLLKSISSILEAEIGHLVKPIEYEAVHDTYWLADFSNILIRSLHEQHIPLWIGANLILTTVQLYRFGPVERNIQIGTPREVSVSDMLCLERKFYSTVGNLAHVLLYMGKAGTWCHISH